MRINIVPMSVNKAWRGGPRYRTNDYKDYEKELFYKLPKMKIPEGKLFLKLEIGTSSKRADLDNFCKVFLDVLSKKYDFNDNRIYGMDLWKEDVEKGKEFIYFNISAL